MRTYKLTTKWDPFEVISTTKAVSLQEATYLFSQIKRMGEGELLKLFYVVKGDKDVF